MHIPSGNELTHWDMNIHAAIMQNTSLNIFSLKDILVGEGHIKNSSFVFHEGPTDNKSPLD